MAVKYVSEFSFPSEFGFHKPSSNSGKGVAKGMGAFHTSKAGPSVVTGHSSGKGGGKFHSGSVPKFAKGGGVNFEKHSGVNKNSGMGHTSSAEVADKAQGDGSLKYGRISDTKSPPATRGEKSSGVQKPAFKSGGHATTPQRYARGGAADSLHESGCKCSYCSGGMAKKEGGSIKVAAGKVKDGAKTPWNKDDGTSPGSFKRTPPGEKMTNKKAAYSKFDAEGRDTEPATEQNGNVERMSEFSDFKRGGHAKKATTPMRFAKGGHAKYAEGGGDIEPGADRYETRDTNEHGGTEEPAGTTTSHGMKGGGRVHNLGKYAHPAKKGGHASGGDVKVPGTRTEKASGHAASMGKVVNTSPQGNDAHYEHEAGTPDTDSGGDYHEITSGSAAAMGGLSRGSSRGKNAAIHAKNDHKAMGAIGKLAGALSAGPPPGMGGPPPGMPPMGGPPPGAPPMGAGRPMAGPPPGMGAGPAPMAPQGGGMPHMADGGAVQHIVVHHVHHG